MEMSEQAIYDILNSRTKQKQANLSKEEQRREAEEYRKVCIKEVFQELTGRPMHDIEYIEYVDLMDQEGYCYLVINGGTEFEKNFGWLNIKTYIEYLKYDGRFT